MNSMNIEFLGSNGGIGGTAEFNPGSTCIQVSEGILIDAGTGLAKLTVEQMSKIRHVFLTHAHLDHICCLPLFLANIIGKNNDGPVTIHANSSTLDALQQHVFNQVLWPDFTRLPAHEPQLLQFNTLVSRQVITVDGIELTAFATTHTVPTLGYAIKKAGVHTVFAADTTLTDALVAELQRFSAVDHLILECSFASADEALAIRTGHLTPALIRQLLQRLEQPPQQVWLTHLKPTAVSAIVSELEPSWALVSSH